jgi:hypothetical protein
VRCTSAMSVSVQHVTSATHFQPHTDMRHACSYGGEKFSLLQVPSTTKPAPRCPTAGHTMIWTLNTDADYLDYECNGCCGSGNYNESARWFCKSCHDDFCPRCQPPPDTEPTTAVAQIDVSNVKVNDAMPGRWSLCVNGNKIE